MPACTNNYICKHEAGGSTARLRSFLISWRRTAVLSYVYVVNGTHFQFFRDSMVLVS